MILILLFRIPCFIIRRGSCRRVGGSFLMRRVFLDDWKDDE
ncbi:acyl carrier protein [Streptococcus thermophilus JIM 8232]|nr:acyl carrier protein [Streptococcus thermophilus JIM 8232]